MPDLQVATPELEDSSTGGQRRFAVAWRNRSTRRISPVGVLSCNGGTYTFRYLASTREVPDFRPLLGFPDLERTYASARLFPFFAQRVMDKRRPDYERYLHALDLPVTASQLDVLGRGGGQRKADRIQVVEEPHVDGDGRTACTFVVHGIRHQSSAEPALLDSLQPGDELTLRPEPDNPANPRALVVSTLAGVGIGWVPDLLLDYVHTVVQSSAAQLVVRRVNGPDLPPHLRLVVRLVGSAPAGYLTFHGDAWRPVGTPMSSSI